MQAAGPGAWRAIVEEAGDLLAEPPDPASGRCSGASATAWTRRSSRRPGTGGSSRTTNRRSSGYDQDLWANALHGPTDDPQLLLATLEALRRANLALWANSTEQDRSRVGIHAERGPESYELTFRLIAGHDRFHLDQARRALAAVRSG